MPTWIAASTGSTSRGDKLMQHARGLYALSATFMLALAASAAQEPFDWKSFSSPEMKFEAMLPGEAQPYAERRRAKNGLTAISRVYGAGNPQFFCTAGYTIYVGKLGDDKRSPLEAARDDFVAAFYATELESREVSVPRSPDGSLKAIRFIAISDERRYTAIMAQDGDRVYEVVASSVRFGFSPDDVDRCLAGFKVMGAP